jgi:hypothetical protein
VKLLLRERWRLVAMAAAPCLVALLASTLHLLSPRTTGVEGDWSAKAIDGPVVAGRAVVSGDHTALDLRSGKTVTLGSVRGGTPYIGDERLVIASPGRVDSARLDASARWTWRAAVGENASPVAASGGSTIVLACPASGTCRLVGLDPHGRESWTQPGVTRRAPLPAGALPLVDGATLGDGVLVTDPESGRTALRPGRSLLMVPDGPVVTEVVQDGSCVLTAYLSTDPGWTRVLSGCPTDQPPRLATEPDDPETLVVTWPSTSERLDLASGKPAQPPAEHTAGDRAEVVVLHQGGMTATESHRTVRTNPFRWGARVTVLRLLDRSGAVRAQIVSDRPLAPLSLDASGVVVRDGDEIVHYSF